MKTYLVMVEGLVKRYISSVKLSARMIGNMEHVELRINDQFELLNTQPKRQVDENIRLNDFLRRMYE